MRLRKQAGIEDKIKELNHLFIDNPEEKKDNWKDVFGNGNPIHVELGGGKGRFLTTLAQRNPDINYIFIELRGEVMMKAIEKVQEQKITNIKFVLRNIDKIEEFFGRDEMDRFYINFCDPWPKARHYKRRLTYRGRLKKYSQILKSDGWVHFKTDELSLFEFSLNEFVDLNLKVKNISLDLHSSTMEDNIMTEYEEKFSNRGRNINRAEISLKNLRED
jgi:tRNA (guanine-N7-)-methyltransferase